MLASRLEAHLGDRTADLAGPTERIAAVEWLRVLAMLEIVRFHDEGNRLAWIGGLGLPTFLLLTNVFSCLLSERRGPERFLTDRRRRLLLPWLFWSCVYALLLVASALHRHLSIGSVLSWDMLVAGTSPHLWFVPFALCSSILVASTQHATRDLGHRATAYTAVALGALAVVGVAWIPEEPLAAPLPQWRLALPATFLGFGLGRLALRGAGALERRDALVLAGLGLLGSLAYAVAHTSDVIWRYSVALLFVLGAFLLPGKSGRAMRVLSPLLFGIYLLHPLMGSRILARVAWLRHRQLFFVVDFVCSALGVRVLRSTPLRRFV